MYIAARSASTINTQVQFGDLNARIFLCRFFNVNCVCTLLFACQLIKDLVCVIVGRNDECDWYIGNHQGGIL